MTKIDRLKNQLDDLLEVYPHDIELLSLRGSIGDILGNNNIEEFLFDYIQIGNIFNCICSKVDLND